VETPLHEAAGIQPLVAHSPLMSWVYAVFSERAFSALLGVAEVAIAAMIYLRSVSAKVSAIGSGLAAVMFLTTLTFLFSTPVGNRVWEASQHCQRCPASFSSKTSCY
jgi:reactive chlorine resistance protein C